MTGNSLIMVIFLIPTILIVLVFFAAYRSSLGATESSTGMVNPNKKRLLFFSLLSAVLVIFLSVTLPKSPYFLFSDKEPSKVIYVAAQQFSYIMSTEAIDPKNTGSGQTIELPANEPIEFRVTSLDVNHGFVIYNEKAEIVAQTQAMPGYMNRLRWKFEQPGTYNILCLEFCGAGHQVMRSSFTVK